VKFVNGLSKVATTSTPFSNSLSPFVTTLCRIHPLRTPTTLRDVCGVSITVATHGTFHGFITSAKEGGYVFGSVCLSVCLFVCLSVGLLANL